MRRQLHLHQPCIQLEHATMRRQLLHLRSAYKPWSPKSPNCASKSPICSHNSPHSENNLNNHVCGLKAHHREKLKNDGLERVFSPLSSSPCPEFDKLASREESLAADVSVYCPPSSQDDITWFKNALEHEERKFFVAFVLKEPRTVPEILYEPMMRAAVYERDPSKNRALYHRALQ